MAVNIRGITIQLGADTSKLSSALNSANKSIKATQSELKSVEKALKFEPGNATLLADKMNILKDKTEAAKDKVKTLKEAQEKLDARGVDKNSEQYKTLQREIDLAEAEVRQLEAQTKEFGSVGAQQVAAVGEKMKTIGDSIANVGKTLTTHVTLPLVAAGTAGAAKFAEVDKTMQLTNATMKNSEEEAKLLSDAMKDAAANSTFGMNDAANAALNFARGGWDAEQAANALAPAMNLAAGEGGNLDTVSAGLMATMNGFGAEATDAAKYADVFANACNSSALDVDGLSGAMSVAAPIFAAAGYEVNDAALYMGVMANAGIEASVAANSLKTGLARLVEPSKEGANWMEKLGISVTNTDGTMKDSITIQEQMHDAFAGLSESEQIAAASAIFGKNQMSNWLALINTAPGDVNELSEALSKQGTTTKMANAMMSGFGGSMEKLKSSVDVAATSLGEALAPTILKVADAIQGAVDWFNGLSDAQKQTVAKIGLVVAAIGPALTVIGKLTSGIGGLLVHAPQIVSAFGTVASFFSATLIPAISGVVAAVAPVIAAFAPFIAIGAAVVAAGVLIYKNWDTIKEKAIELAAAVKEKFEQVKNTVQTIFVAVATVITSKLIYIKDTVKEALENVRDFFQSKLDAVKNLVQTILVSVATFFLSKLNEIKYNVSNALEAVRQFFQSKLDAVKSLVDSVLNAIKNFFTEKLNAVKETVQTILVAVATIFVSKLNEIKYNVSNVLDAIKQFFSEKLDAVKSKADSILNGLKSIFTDTFNNIKSHVSGVVDWLKGIFDFEWHLPSIKLPHFKLEGEFNIEKGTVPTLSVDWYDKGGIFYNPAVIGVGEKRPEFVGALDDLRAIVREESGGGALMQEMVRLMTIMVEQGGRPITVNQEIYADSTSYSEQQKQAAREFRNIARALT